MAENENKLSSEKETQNEITPSIPQKDNELIPEDAKQFKHIFSMVSQSFRGTFPPTVYEKVTSDHIGKVLDSYTREAEFKYKYASSQRWFNLGYVLLSVVLFVFLTIYLSSNQSGTYLDILKTIFVFAGGFGGGYGYKSSRNK